MARKKDAQPDPKKWREESRKQVRTGRRSVLGLGPIRIPLSDMLADMFPDRSPLERKREFVNHQLEARMDLYLEKLGKLGLAQKLGRLGVEDFMVDDSGMLDPQTGKFNKIDWREADIVMFVGFVDSYLDNWFRAPKQHKRTKTDAVLEACDVYRVGHIPRTAGITKEALATRYRQESKKLKSKKPNLASRKSSLNNTC